MNNPLPDLPPQEYEALKASIAQYGVLVPIITYHGRIIDGHQRQRACDELGIKCPAIVIDKLAPGQEGELAITLNLCRRQLTDAQKREMAAALLRETPSKSNRGIGVTVGLDKNTVADVRRRLEASGEIPHCEQRDGQDGRTCRIAKINAETPAQIKRATDALAKLGDAAPDRTIRLGRAEQMVARQEDQRHEMLPPVPQDGADPIQILQSDFRELKIADESVKLLFTDPLYHKKHLPLYGDLGDRAARWLRPDGCLVAYCGNMFVDDVMALLRQHLTFHSLAVLVLGGIGENRLQPIHARQMRSGWKPLLVYGKPEFAPRKYITDLFFGTGKEKELDEFQQNIEQAVYYIDALTQPGDLIVDCFGGSFTTAEAILRVGGGRRFIGCDIREDKVRQGRARIARVRAELAKTNSEKTPA